MVPLLLKTGNFVSKKSHPQIGQVLEMGVLYSVRSRLSPDELFCSALHYAFDKWLMSPRSLALRLCSMTCSVSLFSHDFFGKHLLPSTRCADLLVCDLKYFHTPSLVLSVLRQLEAIRYLNTVLQASIWLLKFPSIYSD